MLTPRGRSLGALVASVLLATSVSATPLSPAAARTPGRAYAFEAMQGRGSHLPVGWNPCRPVRVAVNLHRAPASSLSLVMRALSDVERASGIRMEYAGASHRGAARGMRPGVLVSWSNARHLRSLAGSVVGMGGAGWSQSGRGHRYYSRGLLTLDSPAFRRMSEGLRLAVIEHELGHVMGLAHVHDPHQLMYPVQRHQRGYAAGDLAGLARLGRIPCR